MAQQINLLSPRLRSRAQRLRVGFWLLPALAASALALGIWRSQQEQLDRALRARQTIEQEIRLARSRLVEIEQNTLKPPSAAEAGIQRQRAQLLAGLQSRAAALGNREGFSAQFELLSSLASDGVWLTAVEMGHSESGISVTGQATDPTHAMQHIQRLRNGLAALGYRGYEIRQTSAAGGMPAATQFRIY